MPASMRASAPFWRERAAGRAAGRRRSWPAPWHGITDGTRPGGYATREEVALMAERVYSGRA